jgi:hypothetical protein
MTETEICLDFIKEFYFITVTQQRGDDTIIFHDCCEVKNTNKLHYIGTVFGYDVFLIWDKAEIMTNINIQMKENDAIVNFAKSIKNSQTFSFFKYLTDSLNKHNKTIQLPLQEVKEEFPVLYGEDIEENYFTMDYLSGPPTIQASQVLSPAHLNQNNSQ